MSYTWKKFTRLVAHPERERELVKFTFSSIFPESFCVIDLKVTESHYCGSFPILSQAYVLYSCRCCALAKGTPPPRCPPHPQNDPTSIKSSPVVPYDRWDAGHKWLAPYSTSMYRIEESASIWRPRILEILFVRAKILDVLLSIL